MTYNHRTGATKKKTKKPWIVTVALLLFIAGSYLGVNVLGAAAPSSMFGETEAVAETLTKRQPESEHNRLYVPKIGVNVEVLHGVDNKIPEGSAWHRVPENGDPVSGGNFVLAAHRFTLGLTPTQTRASSPFYHIDKLQLGDDIYVDYKGVRYAYKVASKQKVASNKAEIESRTDEAQLTLYSGNPAGPEQGGEVIHAQPVGTIAWMNGQPKLKSVQ